MGTRHMIAVVVDGQYRVAQYGQWDGYPSGQGVGVLNFISGNKLNALKANALKCAFITNDEYNALVNNYTYTNGQENAERFFVEYPQFSRDTGSNILGLIANADDGLKLWDDYAFAADSLFCEWAYVVDFDNNTFEVYKGFNQTPLEAHERFFGMDCERYEDAKASDRYYPVRLVKTFSLFDLPTVDEFVSEVERIDEGDELDE